MKSGSIQKIKNLAMLVVIDSIIRRINHASDDAIDDDYSDPRYADDDSDDDLDDRYDGKYATRSADDIDNDDLSHVSHLTEVYEDVKSVTEDDYDALL